MSNYLLDHKDEGNRLEWQSQLPAYNLHTELSNLPIRPGQKVLDAGCGTGLVSRFLATEYPGALINGCDFSDLRLQQAKKSSTSFSNIQFFQSDLAHIENEDNTYNHIVCRYVFEHLVSPADVARDFLRVLRPEGTVHIVNFDGLIHNLYPMDKELQSLTEGVTQSIHYDLMIGRKIPHILHSCGFTNISWDVSSVKFTDEDLESEIALTKERLRLTRPAFIKALGSEQRADRFYRLYCEQMAAKGSTLFYNKFIVHADKPK